MGARRSIATKRSARRGVTLLEAIVSLTIIAAVAVVCMQLRAQGFAQAHSLEERRVAEETAAAVLEMAIDGLLPGAVGPVEGDPAQRVAWRGERAGMEYACSREIVTIVNPALAVTGETGAELLGRTIDMERFVAVCGGATAEMLVPRNR